MFEFILVVLVILDTVVVTLMALWLNHMANALNALGQRVGRLENRAIAKSNDPVANFKTL